MKKQASNIEGGNKKEGSRNLVYEVTKKLRRPKHHHHIERSHAHIWYALNSILIIICAFDGGACIHCSFAQAAALLFPIYSLSSAGLRLAQGQWKALFAISQ